MNYKKNFKHYILILLISSLLLLTACLPDADGPEQTEPTAVPVVLIQTSPLSETASPTAIVEATAAETVTATVTSTATPTGVADIDSAPATSSCTDAASFVADVTIPDNSQMAPGTGFIKTWRVKNNGTCTWNNQYQLAHSSGSLLGAMIGNFALPTSVAPGHTVDLSVSLVSPLADGSYQSYWQLVNPEGLRFGVGSQNSPLWVKVVVVSPQAVDQGSISGFAWQDQDFDNQVEESEFLPNVSITLAVGANCGNVLQTTTTDGNGRFHFNNLAAGNYCLNGSDGSVTVNQSGLLLTENQQLNDVNVTWPPVWPDPGSISGWVWADGSGATEADGMIEPDETYIAGVTVKLMSGSCVGDDIPAQLTLETSSAGNYSFEGLQPGVYCVFIDAVKASNVAILGNGNWAFPSHDVGFQEIALIAGEHANPVNFGWDYDEDQN